MIIKYQAGDYADRTTVHPVEVVHETAGTVTVRERHRTARRSKAITERPIFDTWEEARDYLEEKAHRNLDRCLESVDQARERIRTIRALEKPNG